MGVSRERGKTSLSYLRKKALCFGDWAEMYLGWLKLKDNSNVMFLKYKDLEDDFGKQVRSIATHCNMALDDDQIERITTLKSCNSLRCKKLHLPRTKLLILIIISYL